MSERCPDVLDGVQCQLVAGHDHPAVHVSGSSRTVGRATWLLGRPYDTDVPDRELPWATGFPSDLAE
jgi:metallophosphoesterase superfamily enzyme